MSPFLQHALHVAAHALGMALAWHLGRRFERRRAKRFLHDLLAPLPPEAAIEAFKALHFIGHSRSER